MWSFKKIWFQLHWLIGISAGTVLVLIGLSGAVFSFHEEVLDWLNPGTSSVTLRDAPELSPSALAQAVQASGETRRIDRITVYSEPGKSAQLTFAAEPGQRRGEVVFADPYTGKVLPEQKGKDFFEWVESLHRWLLLPRDDGKPITGTLAFCLLILSLSGLYLRWPAKPLSLRTWLTFNVQRKGRPFLWGLHSVAGTWALVVYVMLTLTGMYWAFDSFRAPVDRWLGAPSRSAARAETQAAQEAARKAPQAPLVPTALEPAWNSFKQTAPGWQFAQVRVPLRADQAVQIYWFDASAPHDRARNQLAVKLDGTVQRDERFADLPPGRRALLALYPLHIGTYFGLTGRIIVTLAGLMLPLFAITGWMLYLDRRRKARAINNEQGALVDDSVVASNAIAVIHASQSGHAQQLAARTVARLRSAGQPAQLLSVAQLNLHSLQQHAQVLWVASTFGEGQPPDTARRFARMLEQATGTPLAQQRFALLALGDRQYGAFCGFGKSLAVQLQRLGASTLFPIIAMDGEDDAAWHAWSAQLAEHWGTANLQELVPAEENTDPPEAAFHAWALSARTHCNPGSVGTPLHRIELTPPAGLSPQWQAGALVEVCPQHAPDVVKEWLQTRHLDGDALVTWRGQSTALRNALAACVLPDADVQALSPQQLADQLHLLPARSYSVASLPQDGVIQLLVRQTILDETQGQKPRLGLASGWLTQHAALGSTVMLRLVENASFAPFETPGWPAIFIGNGSGYAGLRGHLLDRIRNGQYENWLIFGERQRANDSYAQDEVREWLEQGQVQRADHVYSRDAISNTSQHRYVQDALREAPAQLRAWKARGAVIYVCGSYDGMATGVDNVLTELLGEAGMDELIASGRYRRDVY